jgi:hypothetical protein
MAELDRNTEPDFIAARLSAWAVAADQRAQAILAQNAGRAGAWPAEANASLADLFTIHETAIRTLAGVQAGTEDGRLAKARALLTCFAHRPDAMERAEPLEQLAFSLAMDLLAGDAAAA